MRQHTLPRFIAVMLVGGLLAACGGDGETSVDDGSGDAAAASDGEGLEDGVVVQMDGESREDYIDRLYEAAQEEGTVAYYTSANDVETQAIIDSWDEMFPEVGFDPVSATSGTLLERALLESESGNVQGDVYHASSGDVAVLEAAGAREEYRPVNEADVAEEFKTEGPYVAASYLSYHPAFNTDLVDEADLPDDWMGYCDEEWRGQLAIDQEGADWIAGLLAGMGEEAGMEFLQCLAANEPRLVRGTSNRTELLAAGEFAVMLDGYGHSLREFEQQGAPIRAQRPSPDPLPVMPQFEMMFKDAPHPNAARLLVEFFLTPEGQQVWLNRNKAGVLAGDEQEHPYGELMEDAEVVVLGPGEADFDETFQIFNDTFLGGEAPAP
ncbi:MAG: extracellular solute-binding protein [Nitriliruptorales bacterium]|nr:extracellular solute-binding protein [Nitriliruptorales bacterium]